MKILITVQTYYPKKDGVQMVTEYLAEGLAKLGNEVTIITSSRTDLQCEEKYKSVNIKRIYLYTKYGLYFGKRRKYLEKVKEEVKDKDIIINVCTQNAFTDLLLEHLDEFKCKKVLYLHGMYDFKWHRYDFKSFKDICNKVWKNIRWRIYYKKNRKNFKKYNKVIQIHKLCTGYEFFKKNYNIDADIIENAVDADFFVNKEIINTNKEYAICVANYLEDKNQELVLKAFYEAKTGKNMKLIFIGGRKGKYYEKLTKINKKLQNAYGEREVLFLSNMDRLTTKNLIKNASIYLFGSKHEIYPVSIIEAMAAGIPFICTDVGCVRALPGGLIVKNNNEMSYMIDLLNKNNELKKEMGKIGREYAKKNLIEEKKIKEFYRVLCDIVEVKDNEK